MNITSLIKRLLDEGKDNLSEQDVTALLAYKEPDTAGLRDEIATLKAQLAVSKTAKDQSGAALSEIRTQMAELTKAVETERKARLAAETEAKAIRRTQAIDAIRTKHGINFIEGIDPEITRSAFARAFDGLEDFKDDAKVSAAVDGFRKSNGGLIRAASGAGGAFGGTHATQPPGTSNIAAMAKTLTDAGIIRAGK